MTQLKTLPASNRGGTLRRVLAAACWASFSAVGAQPTPSAPAPAAPARLAQLQAEIATLRGDLERMAGRERGLLSEIERLGAELRLRETEHAEVSLRLEEVVTAIERRDRTLERLDGAQAERRRYLEFRLREIYKAGELDGLRRMLGSEASADAWTAAGYASYLSRRDAEVLAAYQSDVLRSASERQSLEEAREELTALEEELDSARAKLEQARRSRQAALDGIREDQRTRLAALGELEQAAGELEDAIGGLGQAEPPAAGLDIRKFRGLLTWPAEGPVAEGFGRVVHPRFNTEVPHPGLDIDAPQDSDIRAVFEGQVAFAESMRGYGLTVIVDHGHGLLTIYAHASALLVGSGDRVAQGQLLGKVGETGSLRGPYLYFELRVEGKPVDPRIWLRPR